jgi:hypothetical protein
MAKKKIITNRDRVRTQLEEWCHPILESRIGKRNLSEFLWSTSHLYETCDVKQILVDKTEMRRILIEVVHRWITLNRERIKHGWDDLMSSKKRISEQEKLSLRSFKMIQERKMKRG